MEKEKIYKIENHFNDMEKRFSILSNVTTILDNSLRKDFYIQKFLNIYERRFIVL